VVELQESVAVPLPDRLLGVMAAQVNPVGIVSLRDTVLTNPFEGAIVIDRVPEEPVSIALGEESASETVKSCMVMVTGAVWVRPLLDPETVKE
jgi:hypothetical protein